ncbi:hypothetical protein BJ944DRAFT_263718 [Cunninghamella echinulata]|nr:hypothetical protein BJ944DRAFT_263718 [Cunninghamella echinulata]
MELSPGELLEYEDRSENKSLYNNKHKETDITILQWNVERNYEADGIIEEIKRLSPDVCILQEIDIDCERSGNRNHMEELCKSLNMKGVFVCEFLELYSSLRKSRDQGGGFHGNAILSKYDFNVQVIDHKYQPFQWDKDGHLLNEPRKGK